ncbi:Fc receptor-like protein 4 [Clarias gariepinus]|uniref:Fc receptor-like protein 4 n=1 Tax=Clarias gariepinus TaxID=13013 RepID=UPI00234C526C|nr:Fc receptor-like protein 4 [Clarias gariepinus]
MTGTPRPVLSVSPQGWLTEGDSVTLSCEVTDSSTDWTFSWYRHVPYRDSDGDIRYKEVLLSDSSRGSRGSYTIRPVTQNHTGVYRCRGERDGQKVQTDHSNLQPLWITGESSPVSLIINSIRTQHFTVTGSTCEISYLFTLHTGVYWCESESGETSNPVNITIHEIPEAVLSVSPQSWVTEGDSVTLSCEVTDSSTDWTLNWYREVPYRDSYGRIRYKVELLSDSRRGFRGFYTISPVTRNHTGVYMCRGESNGQQVQTYRSHSQPLWITGESPPVSLIINPNRTQHFTGDFISLSCEDQSHSTGWTVRRYTHSSGVSACSPSWWGSFTGSKCNISSLSTSYTGVYWCESESGENSNPVNITVHGPVLSVSPQSWLTEGDSVTLNCKVTDSSTDWTFSWYREVPYRDSDGDIEYKVELLSDSRRGCGGSYTIRTAARKHTGVYTCRGQRDGQQVQPYRSNSQPLWITGESPPVSLIINPIRTQHFTGDSLSLSCEDQSNSTGWTVRRYTHSERVSDCSWWGSVTGSTCNISSLPTYHTGVYWCESESGENSNPVNITVHGESSYVILASPVHPVTEGHPLTLRCLYRYTNSSNLRADFYKDGSVLQTQTTGEIIIHKVSKLDEGFYHCKYTGRGESPQSWVSIRGSAPSSVLMLISSVVTASPYLLVTIILLFKCYRARAQTDEERIENAVVEE